MTHNTLVHMTVHIWPWYFVLHWYCQFDKQHAYNICYSSWGDEITQHVITDFGGFHHSVTRNRLNEIAILVVNADQPRVQYGCQPYRGLFNLMSVCQLGFVVDRCIFSSFEVNFFNQAIKSVQHFSGIGSRTTEGCQMRKLTGSLVFEPANFRLAKLRCWPLDYCWSV